MSYSQIKYIVGEIVKYICWQWQYVRGWMNFGCINLKYSLSNLKGDFYKIKGDSIVFCDKQRSKIINH